MGSNYPTSSSLKSMGGPGWLPAKIDPYSDDPAFWASIEPLVPNLRRIYCAGGEPMLQPSHTRLINLLVASAAAAHIDLVYSSNLTVLPGFDIALFRRFRSVTIGGAGPVYGGIRRGAPWPDFERNVDVYFRYARVRIAATPQGDNAENLPELIEWCRGRGLTVDLTNILQSPKELSIDILPKGVKQRAAGIYEELAVRYLTQGEGRPSRELGAIASTLRFALPIISFRV